MNNTFEYMRDFVARFDELKPMVEDMRETIAKAERVPVLEAQLQTLYDRFDVQLVPVADGTWEVVKRPEQLPLGDFTNPIQWLDGEPVTAGLFYWYDDYDMRKMALADGVPTSWLDAELFEQFEQIGA